LTQADIKSNLALIQERIARACRKAGRSPQEITLIAVTKTVSPSAVEAAFRLGIRHFGENRVQDAGNKIQALSHLQPDLTWHMIGHLQSNKVKSALELFDIIQSVDSAGLAKSISRRTERKLPVLLQVNIAAETTKSGFSIAEIQPAFEIISKLANIEVQGLMTIAPMVEDPERVRPIFNKLRGLRDKMHLEHLSMGMTADFEVAIEEGATMIRVGRALFGERGENPGNHPGASCKI